MEFIPSRKNQVFASGKNRRDYHNEIAAELRRVKAPIDKSLEKNFIILSKKVKSGENKFIDKEELLRLGFNPHVFTHLINYNGKTCRCLYHFVLPQSTDTNLINIIHPIND